MFITQLPSFLLQNKMRGTTLKNVKYGMGVHKLVVSIIVLILMRGAVVCKCEIALDGKHNIAHQNYPENVYFK